MCLVVVREGPGARLGSTKPFHGATSQGKGTLVGKYVIPVIETEPITDCYFVLLEKLWLYT